MSQAAAQSMQPSADVSAEVSMIVEGGVEAGMAQRKATADAVRTRTISELESNLRLFEFQEAARLVTAVRMLLEAANGELTATVHYQKAQMRGFDTYVRVRLHKVGAEMTEGNVLSANDFGFTVRENNVIALGHGQQNPRAEDIKKPTMPKGPSMSRVAYNRIARRVGWKEISPNPAVTPVAANERPLTTREQTNTIIQAAATWCAVRGYVDTARLSKHIVACTP